MPEPPCSRIPVLKNPEGCFKPAWGGKKEQQKEGGKDSGVVDVDRRVGVRWRGEQGKGKKYV